MKVLFEKADIKTLAIFRILVGAWFFIDYVSMLIIGRVGEAYIDAQVNFPFYGFEFVKPLPAAGMYILFVLLAFAGAGIMAGFRYYLSLAVFFAGHLYVFLIDIVYSLNKFYLFLILAAVLMFMEANRYWSMDVKSGRVKQIDYVPRWNVMMFQLLYVLIYTFSGISKLNPDWLLQAQPLRSFLRNVWLFRPLSEEAFEVVAYLFSYGGMLFDLSICWLLLNRKTNFFANCWQATFHLLNFFLLGIGTLSLFMAATTWLFFPTPWLKRRIGLQPFSGTVNISPGKRRLVTTLIVIFFVINILIPNRHFLTGNNVNWTEKGHRFSWRLMTRTKSGSSSLFMIKDPESGESWFISPQDYLTPRQFRKMSAETDLVIYFAHWLADEWKKKGFDSVEVRAHVLTRLNRRNPQLLIDSELNLVEVDRTFIRDEISTELEN